MAKLLLRDEIERVRASGGPTREDLDRALARSLGRAISRHTFKRGDDGVPEDCCTLEEIYAGNTITVAELAALHDWFSVRERMRMAKAGKRAREDEWAAEFGATHG